MITLMGVCFREEVEEFFESMDRDFDGRLTFEEFMGEETTLEKLFKNMDKNGDGVVTKQVRLSIIDPINRHVGQPGVHDHLQEPE